MPALETASESVVETRNYAHALIDRMTVRQVDALVVMLETLLKPLDSPPAKIPIEDESISDAEQRDAAGARVDASRGELTSYEDFLAELGLTSQDIENFEDAQVSPAMKPARV